MYLLSLPVYNLRTAFIITVFCTYVAGAPTLTYIRHINNAWCKLKPFTDDRTFWLCVYFAYVPSSLSLIYTLVYMCRYCVSDKSSFFLLSWYQTNVKQRGIHCLALVLSMPYPSTVFVFHLSICILVHKFFIILQEFIGFYSWGFFY